MNNEAFSLKRLKNFRIGDMRFSRNQLIGAFILLALLWGVVLYRVLFSRA